MARVQGAAGKAVRVLGRILPGQADELLQGLFVEPTLGVGAAQSLNAAFLAMFHQSAGMGSSVRDDFGITGALLLGVRADGSLAATYTAVAAGGMAAILTPTFQPLATAAHLETGLAAITYPVANVNLIVNGDFENYPVSPGAPTSWSSTFSGATANRDTAIPYAGQNALRIQATQDAPSNGSIIQVLPALVAGATYYIVARHRTNGSPTAQGRIKVRNNTDSVDVFNINGTAGTLAYERLASTFVALAGKTYQVEVKFGNVATTLNGDAVLWDDIIIFQGPPDLNVGARAGGSFAAGFAAVGAGGMVAGVLAAPFAGPGAGASEAGALAPAFLSANAAATLPSYAAAAVAPGPGAAAQASGSYGTAYVGPGGGIAQAGMLTPAYAAPGAAATIPAGALGAAYTALGAAATIPAAPIAITVNPFGAAGHLETGTLAVVQSNVSPTNLLVNPGFETYPTSPGPPTSWTETFGGQSILSRETSIQHSGLNALRIQANQNNPANGSAIQILPALTAGLTYKVTFWYVTNGSATAQGRFKIRNNTDAVDVINIAGSAGATTAQKLSGSFVAVAGKTYQIEVKWNANATTINGDAIIFDDGMVWATDQSDLGAVGTIGIVTYQTGDRIASKDVFTRTDKTASTCNEDTNRDAQDIRVQNFTGVSIRDGYVGWDLTGMPAGATLVAATLKVNVVTAPGAAADVDLYALANADEGWNETTLKCSTAPASSGAAMQRINFPASTGQKSFALNATVLARLQARMGVGVATLLFRMVGTTINDDVTFDDKESGASVGPRLSLQFTT